MSNLSRQLFKPLPQVELRSRDVKRLEPHLASSGKLNELLVLDSITDEDLQRLLLLEARRPKPRYVIVRKLIARLLSRTRERMIRVAYGPVTFS